MVKKEGGGGGGVEIIFLHSSNTEEKKRRLGGIIGFKRTNIPDITTLTEKISSQTNRKNSKFVQNFHKI